MDVKPKTWRERLPRWMGGTVADDAPKSPAMLALEAQIEAIRAETLAVEASNAAMRARAPRAVPVRRARYETCMDCNDTVDAWRTYADGTRRCLPCDQAVR